MTSRPDPYRRKIGALWRDEDGHYWRLEAIRGQFGHGGAQRAWVPAAGATREEFETLAEAAEYEHWFKSSESTAHLARTDLMHRPSLLDHPMLPSTKLMPGGYYVDALGRLFQQDTGAPYRLAPSTRPSNRLWPGRFSD